MGFPPCHDVEAQRGIGNPAIGRQPAAAGGQPRRRERGDGPRIETAAQRDADRAGAVELTCHGVVVKRDERLAICGVAGMAHVRRLAGVPIAQPAHPAVAVEQQRLRRRCLVRSLHEAARVPLGAEAELGERDRVQVTRQLRQPDERRQAVREPYPVRRDMIIERREAHRIAAEDRPARRRVPGDIGPGAEQPCAAAGAPGIICQSDERGVRQFPPPGGGQAQALGDLHAIVEARFRNERAAPLQRMRGHGRFDPAASPRRGTFPAMPDAALEAGRPIDSGRVVQLRRARREIPVMLQSGRIFASGTRAARRRPVSGRAAIANCVRIVVDPRVIVERAQVLELRRHIRLTLDFRPIVGLI